MIGHFASWESAPAIHLIGGLMGPELVYTLSVEKKCLALTGNGTTIP